MTPAEKLASLRSAMTKLQLTHFIVPKADAFQNGSVPASEDRLQWLTGFTGSAGVAIAMLDSAVLAVDSRYVLQAGAQVDPALYEVFHEENGTLAQTLSKYAKKGDVVGFDPRVHTVSGSKLLREEARQIGYELKPSDTNPIDEIWTDRPAPSFFPIFAHDEKFAGESAHSKLDRVQKALQHKNCDGLLIAAPDAVMWLLNIRGGDVRHTPLALVRAFVPAVGKPTLFLEREHITENNRDWLEALATPFAIGHIEEAFSSLFSEGSRILIDPARATVALKSALEAAHANVVEAPDPCTLFKAIKNETELRGARNAHLRDGAAVCRLLHWLEKAAPLVEVDEIRASEKLEAYRRQLDHFRDLSFDTIAGSGPNGAIVHYHATPETNRKLDVNSLFLLDSGAQYEDGTTDVTRTIAIGTPTADMRRSFTLVLKGHIAIATARFPPESRGVDIDPFARRALWSAGLDYGHGTGHGVGSYLGVHEGPQSLSGNGSAVLEAGMILSNEPGYYREGHYGVRIENLLIVTPPEAIEGGDKPMHSFEALTLVPIDRRLIDIALLSPEELTWLNDYHSRVYREIGPLLDDGDQAWLQHATEPLQISQSQSKPD